MRVKQTNLRCFEFESPDAEEFIEYIKTHEALLKSYVFLLKGRFDAEIDRFLKEGKFVYAWAERSVRLFSRSVSAPVLRSEGGKTLIVRKPVRSGETIRADSDAIFLARVNSGSRIEVSGCVTLLAPLFGMLVCEGGCALLRGIGKGGLLIFHGAVFEERETGLRCFWENGRAEIEEME
ncbi:MAG: hypothetical protein LBT81_01955 [Helicobacteraceae bacterium]|jgi:hypothetical protein|nr:hypothetical protein [Helicobacteraceae bacterium]